MGMICVSDSPNDIHVDYHDLFEAIPENSSNDEVSQEQRQLLVKFLTNKNKNNNGIISK